LGIRKMATIKKPKQSILGGLKAYKTKYILGKKTRLRSKRLSDARNDYKWQTDHELAQLDAAPIIKLAFPVYLLDYLDAVRRPGKNRYPLAIETLDAKHIGNCTCYDIDESNLEAQIGIMIGDREYWDQGYGTDAVTTLVDHIFRYTPAKRIYLKTLDWNTRAQQCFWNCGFNEYIRDFRNGHHFIFMEINREQWQKSAEKHNDESLTN
jgi:RimJ/RimL family protein N-acetyltransferase